MNTRGLWRPSDTVNPYSWIIWGQETVPDGVRLSAARHADVRWERAYAKYGGDTLDLSASLPSGGLIVLEGENWRTVLEGLYRKWQPAPNGDLHHMRIY